MQKLYLHIGTEKTGSTSIQKFLTKNASLLFSNHGILWPQHPKLFLNNGHFPMAGSFLDPVDCDFVPRKSISSPLEVTSTLSKVCGDKQPNVTVLSAEHFSSRFSESNISNLSQLLENFDVTVIIYVRRQDKMALSYFSTGVRYGRREWISPTEVTPSNHIYNIRGLLDSWARYFGKNKIKVRVFENNKLIGGDVIVDLMSVLGINNISDFQTVNLNANEALTTKQIKFILELNKRLPTWKEAAEKQDEEAFRTAQKLREQAIRISEDIASIRESAKISTILSIQDRREILERFSADNDYVARTFLGRLKLFDDLSPGQDGDEPNQKVESGDSDLSKEDMLELVMKSLEMPGH